MKLLIIWWVVGYLLDTYNSIKFCCFIILSPISSEDRDAIPDIVQQAKSTD